MKWQLWLLGLLLAALSWYVVGEHNAWRRETAQIRDRQDSVLQRMASHETELQRMRSDRAENDAARLRLEEKLDALFRELLRHDQTPVRERR